MSDLLFLWLLIILAFILFKEIDKYVEETLLNFENTQIQSWDFLVETLSDLIDEAFGGERIMIESSMPNDRCLELAVNQSTHKISKNKKDTQKSWYLTS